MPNASSTQRAGRRRAAPATGLLRLAFGTAALTTIPHADRAWTANTAQARPGMTSPAALTGPMAAELRGGERVERGWLGILLQPLDEELAGVLGAPDGKGALVAFVEPASPTARAGLKPGDVVIGVAGKPVQQQRDLAAAVAEAKPGSTVAVTVLRGGRRLEFQVAVGELPGAAGRARPMAERSALGIAPQAEVGGDRPQMALPSEAG